MATSKTTEKSGAVIEGAAAKVKPAVPAKTAAPSVAKPAAKPVTKSAAKVAAKPVGSAAAKAPLKPAASKADRPEIVALAPEVKGKKDKKVKKNKKKDKKPKVALEGKDGKKPRLAKKDYENALSMMQIELVKLQEWIKFKKLSVVVVFEGRDAAGKGGSIKRITECLSPRVTRVAALPAPTERERTQWYFQRYVQHLPAAGEMVIFDRSWYNRAGVEHVMGFCSDDEYREFMRSCPEFERMLVRSGIILIKYWFSVSNDEQERRFQKRIYHPTKHWKLSPMDLQSRARWVEYSKAKDEMFSHTDIKQAPWYVVDGDDKERARLNVMTHLLTMIDYQDLTPQRVELPPRQQESGYVRPPMSDQTFVPEVY